MSVIDTFQYEDGSHMPLSNFYHAPVFIGDVWYATNEHYFQAAKSLDPAERLAVASCATPGEAKRAGRSRVTLRGDWEAVKLIVMRTGLEAKFSRENHPQLVDWLLATGDALLVEGNTWGDMYWGRVRGVGTNWLGHLLMARRAELRSGEVIR